MKKKSRFLALMLLSISLVQLRAANLTHVAPCREITELTIFGRVLDAETESPIENASIYISGTTLGTASDSEGNFRIGSLRPGIYTVVVSHVSYERQVFDANLKDMDFDLGTVALSLKTQEVMEVEVTAEKDQYSRYWARDIVKFKESVFGKNYDKKNVDIPNQENAVFKYHLWIGGFGKKSPFDLEIHNSYTGYVLDYAVEDFYVGDGIEEYILGYMRFQEMEPKNKAQKLEWEENRARAFNGSLTHFLKALIADNFEKEGFEARLTTLHPLNRNKRKAIREAKVDTLSAARKPLGFRITETERPNIKRIEFEHFLEFEYWNEPDKKGRPQKSWLYLDQKEMLVYDNGVLVNPRQILLFGYLTSEGLYEILPFDYDPDKK